jgi:hypothetical protein
MRHVKQEAVQRDFGDGPDLLATGRIATPLEVGRRVRDHLPQLPVLWQLVRGLTRLDRADRMLGDDARARDLRFAAAMRTASHLLSITRLARALAHYRAARNDGGARFPPDRLAATTFEQAGGARRLDEASQAAVDARPDDGNAHYLRRLCRAPIDGVAPAREAGRRDRLDDLHFVSGWLDAADDAAATGAVDAEERCLAAALEIDGNAGGARRRYAALVRRRDARAAAAQFATLLDHAPRLPYGVANLVEPYRGFLISFDADVRAFVAQPAYLGVTKLRSLGPLGRRRNRLVGLLAMRIHLARRVAADGGEAARVEPPRGTLVGHVHRWLVARPDLLRFMLTAGTEAALRWRIDQAHRIWLTPARDV